MGKLTRSRVLWGEGGGGGGFARPQGAGMGYDRTMRGGGEDPILQTCLAPLPPLMATIYIELINILF